MRRSGWNFDGAAAGKGGAGTARTSWNFRWDPALVREEEAPRAAHLVHLHLDKNIFKHPQYVHT